MEKPPVLVATSAPAPAPPAAPTLPSRNLATNGQGAMKLERITSDVYDILPPRRESRSEQKSVKFANLPAEANTSELERLSVSSVDSKDSDYQALITAKTLHITVNAAMDTIVEHQQTLQV